MKYIRNIVSAIISLILTILIVLALNGTFNKQASKLVQSLTDGEENQFGDSTRRTVNGKTLAEDEEGNVITNEKGQYKIEETSTVAPRVNVSREFIESLGWTKESKITDEECNEVYEKYKDTVNPEEINIDKMVETLSISGSYTEDEVRAMTKHPLELMDTYFDFINQDYGDEGFWDDYEEEMDDIEDGNMYIISTVDEYNNWLDIDSEGTTVELIFKDLISNAEISDDSAVLTLMDGYQLWVYGEEVKKICKNTISLIGVYEGEGNGYGWFNCISVQ